MAPYDPEGTDGLMEEMLPADCLSIQEIGTAGAWTRARASPPLPPPCACALAPPVPPSPMVRNLLRPAATTCPPRPWRQQSNAVCAMTIDHPRPLRVLSNRRRGHGPGLVLLARDRRVYGV
jgi:hypothetical protein